MKTLYLLPCAVLALAASPVFAGAPPGYRVEGCESGTCRLVKESAGASISRSLGGSSAYQQAQRGFETRSAEDPGTGTPAPAASKPSPCSGSGATAASCPLSGGPVGPALEVPPPAAAAAKAEGGGGAAAKGACGGGKCKVKRKGLLGFFDAIASAVSSLFA